MPDINADFFGKSVGSSLTLEQSFSRVNDALSEPEQESPARAIVDEALQLLPFHMKDRTRESIAGGTVDFLKTAALFYRTPLGGIAYTALSSMDEPKHYSSGAGYLADFGLGAVKGYLTWKAVDTIGDLKMNPIASGVGLSMASQVIDLGLTRSTYDHGLFQGVKRIGETVLDPRAIATNAIVFGAGYAAFSGVNALTGSAVSRSPMLRTMISAGTMGVALGSLGEVERERVQHQEFDYSKIAWAGAKQGLLNSLAAAPGGYRADPLLRERVNDFFDNKPADHVSIRGYDYGDPVAKRYYVPKDGEIANLKQIAQESVVRISSGLGMGSGFVITEDGGIVTNSHVVDSNRTVRLQMADGTTYKADVVMNDIAHDVALIKITNAGGQKFTPMQFDMMPMQGEHVVAAGYPRGTDVLNLSAGQVQSIQDEGFWLRQPQTSKYSTSMMSEYEFSQKFQGMPMLQEPAYGTVQVQEPGGNFIRFKHVSLPMVDATMNVQGGNSGGPILNMDGKVVGFVSRGSPYESLAIRPQTLLDSMRAFNLTKGS